MSKKYCMINKQTNVCDNIIEWDGNINHWTPPENYTMVLHSNTKSKTWKLNKDFTQWVLTESFGNCEIGYIFDGEFYITNQPQPTEIPVLEPQPEVSGAQTI